MMTNDIDDDFSDEPKSKSQLKRDMQELQDLGVQLTQLPLSILAKIPLDAQLYDAVIQAENIYEKSGKKRHLQFIGKLMRHADGDAIRAALAKLDDDKKRSARQLHIVEQWRDRLLANEDNALSDFFDHYPNSDRQVLRNLMRAAQKEKEHNKPPASARKLFKYLRDAIH